MKTVWKYTINFAFTALTGPVVHVGLDPSGTPCVWIEGDPEKLMDRLFEVVGTGQRVPVDGTHVGSWVDGAFVWHLYERRAVRR